MQGPGHIITTTLIKTAKGFGFTLLGEITVSFSHSALIDWKIFSVVKPFVVYYYLNYHSPGGDKVGQPILIKSIKKGSSADQQKMLQVNIFSIWHFLQHHWGLLSISITTFPQPYDVLIRVNSTLVNTLNHSQVVAIFKSLPIGTPTYLELRRPGEEMRPKQRVRNSFWNFN